MIKAKDFYRELEKNNLGDYIQVPCSILEPVINYLNDLKKEVINPVNEAVAMGIAAGTYMASKKIPIVMMQNSGLLNTLNALTSLNQTYKIPSLYIITWRGCPKNGKDAPEHEITGKNLEEYMEIFEIPYKVISEKHYKKQISSIIKEIKKTSKPAALILRKGIIEGYNHKNIIANKNKISRYAVLEKIKEIAGDNVYYISTTGFISRDSFSIKDTKDFYMLGSMGHALPIGIGAAKKKPGKKFIVLDGDGASLMHAGAMASIGKEKPKNLTHIVLDNCAYASTGCQPTLAKYIDFKQIAKGCGYKNIAEARTLTSLEKEVKKSISNEGPNFIHVYISEGTKAGKRVSDKYSCEKIKKRFMSKLDK